MLLVKQHSKIGIRFAPAIDEEVYSEATSFEVATCPTLRVGDERKFVQKQPHSRLQRVPSSNDCFLKQVITLEI